MVPRAGPSGGCSERLWVSLPIILVVNWRRTLRGSLAHPVNICSFSRESWDILGSWKTRQQDLESDVLLSIKQHGQ